MDSRFSPLENQILGVIGKQAISIREVTKEIYDGEAIDKNNVVASAIRRINKKCGRLQLKWFIDGIGQGRGGRQVWRVNR